jgi:hypothetical protein
MGSNRLDDCDTCELLPTTTGRWVRATQVRCPVHGSRPDALPADPTPPPAEIPESLMLDLLRHVDVSDGLDVAEDELLHHRRTKGYIWAIKAAWADGRTAAAADIRAEADSARAIEGGPDLMRWAADLAEGTETDG